MSQQWFRLGYENTNLSLNLQIFLHFICKCAEKPDTGTGCPDAPSWDTHPYPADRPAIHPAIRHLRHTLPGNRATLAAWFSYKGLVLSVQGPCSDTTKAL